MLVELSMVEQRYLAVREVLDSGAKISDVATRYGVDRRTVQRWLLRYANEGLGALADSQLEARSLSSPDQPPARGTDRVAKKSSSRMGSPDDPEQAQKRTGPGSFPLRDLSLSRASSPHRTQAAETPTRRLQALGAIAVDGIVATGRDGQRPSEQWDRAVAGDGDR
jgi:transposase-like protein